MTAWTKHLALAAALALGAVTAGSAGCGSSGDNRFNDGADAGVDAADLDAQFQDGDCLFGCGNGDSSTTQQLVIAPQNVVLTVTNGNVQTQDFTVTFNGNDVTSQVSWSYDTPIIGDVLSGATFTPTGKVAGVGTLTATIPNAKGTTTVSVKINKTVVGGGVSQQQQQSLDNPAGPADTAQLVYPYDKTVFPLAVLAPEMQWNGAGNADVYRLELKEKFYDYVEYFATGTPSRHLVAQADWDSLESSGQGPNSDPVAVSLTRMSGSTAYKPIQQTWHIAQGKLHGSVYYWELPDACGNSSTGRILRIKPDSTTVDQFFTNNGQCWGCHTVSRDGSTVMASFNFPVKTVDVSKNPATLGQYTYMPQGTFSAFDNTGKAALVSTDQFSSYQIHLYDVTNGQQIKPNVFSAFGYAGEPAWSPDGKKIAAITGGSGSGWFFDSSSGQLTVGDVGANYAFSNFKTIVKQNQLPQGRPAYPSFDPTSGWITFGNPTAGSRSTGSGSLWMVQTDGTNLKEIKTAASDGKSFNPVFAPLRAGGYSWVVFITRRNYGNEIVGANRQQLWVTAIDDPPSATDPSHPPFYMRGQETCAKSENAYYALDPCKKVGENCTSGVDCCGGQCIKDPNTKQYTCGNNPQNGCSSDGNACKSDSDCCDAPQSKCVDGFCQKPPPN